MLVLYCGVYSYIINFNFVQAVFSFITMQLQFCSVFFTFSLGTRTHYFGRTILHGGAKVHKILFIVTKC
jgi:callose synthase